MRCSAPVSIKLGGRKIDGVDVVNWTPQFRITGMVIANPDFPGKVPHFSAKHKIFLQAVKYAERALFARIQLGRSWARYPCRPRAFFGEPHVVTV